MSMFTCRSPPSETRLWPSSIYWRQHEKPQICLLCYTCEFEGLQGKIRTGSPNMPAFKSSFCSVHAPTVAVCYDISGDDNNITVENSQKLAPSNSEQHPIGLITEKGTTRNSTLYKVYIQYISCVLDNQSLHMCAHGIGSNLTCINHSISDIIPQCKSTQDSAQQIIQILVIVHSMTQCNLNMCRLFCWAGQWHAVVGNMHPLYKLPYSEELWRWHLKRALYKESFTSGIRTVSATQKDTQDSSPKPKQPRVDFDDHDASNSG